MLYGRFIRPLQPFAIKGVLWDQGEAGTEVRDVDQTTLMGALIRGWRKDWGQGDFPFIYDEKPSGGGCAWDETNPVTSRAEKWTPLPAKVPEDGSETETYIRIMRYPNTGIAISSDLGPGIHPVNKSGYGVRAADVALGLAYGKPAEYYGPIYQSYSVECDKVRVKFTDVGQGLAFKYGDKLQGFALAGEDRVFHWADASIDGDTVMLSCAAVAKPVAVRYAWAAKRPWANLFNKDGLPAIPFRTDDWVSEAAGGTRSPGLQPFAGTRFSWPGERLDTWNGFTRHIFDVDGCRAWVIEPRQPAPGNPWTWCMAFPDAYTDRTGVLRLLEKGFFDVTIEVGNTFGCPDALKHFDAFYRAITEKGLAKRGTLIGISRGGLYAYNWGARNPDKVVAIYGDARVCDFKSWPGGKGKGRGSPVDWALLMKCYGFADEAAAMAWKENPVDELEPLARAKIPLIHVVGDADNTVPPAENTAIVEQRYKGQGGAITVIHKAGCGHRPTALMTRNRSWISSSKPRRRHQPASRRRCPSGTHGCVGGTRQNSACSSIGASIPCPPAFTRARSPTQASGFRTDAGFPARNTRS